MGVLIQSGGTRLVLCPLVDYFSFDFVSRAFKLIRSPACQKLLEDVSIGLDAEKRKGRSDFVEGLLGEEAARHAPIFTHRTLRPPVRMNRSIRNIFVFSGNDAEIQSAVCPIWCDDYVARLHLICKSQENSSPYRYSPRFGLWVGAGKRRLKPIAVFADRPDITDVPADADEAFIDKFVRQCIVVDAPHRHHGLVPFRYHLNFTPKPSRRWLMVSPLSLVLRTRNRNMHRDSRSSCPRGIRRPSADSGRLPLSRPDAGAGPACRRRRPFPSLWWSRTANWPSMRWRRRLPPAPPAGHVAGGPPGGPLRGGIVGFAEQPSNPGRIRVPGLTQFTRMPWRVWSGAGQGQRAEWALGRTGMGALRQAGDSGDGDYDVDAPRCCTSATWQRTARSSGCSLRVEVEHGDQGTHRILMLLMDDGRSVPAMRCKCVKRANCLRDSRN